MNYAEKKYEEWELHWRTHCVAKYGLGGLISSNKIIEREKEAFKTGWFAAVNEAKRRVDANKGVEFIVVYLEHENIEIYNETFATKEEVEKWQEENDTLKHVVIGPVPKGAKLEWHT